MARHALSLRLLSRLPSGTRVVVASPARGVRAPTGRCERPWGLRRYSAAGSGPLHKEETWCIAGLGNPGPEYERSRHNVGFMVLDALARQLHAPLSRSAHGAAYAAARLGEHSVLLVKPMTFMNRSGAPLAALTQRHGIPPCRTLVVHDCLDLPLGALRLRAGGSAGGHNGMRSVMATLGGGKAGVAPELSPARKAGEASRLGLSAPPPRLRVGIGRPEGRQSIADFVLEAFSRREQEVLEVDIARAVDAIRAVVALGLETAMAGGRVGRVGREAPAAKAGQKRGRQEG